MIVLYHLKSCFPTVFISNIFLRVSIKYLWFCLHISEKYVIFVKNKEKMKIIVPIGISGSGKSWLYKMKYNHLALLSPDLIRKELTGNIGDQSKNKEVFDEVDRRVDMMVKKGESFFYDATNVNSEFRKKFVNRFRGTDIKIIYVILPSDVEASYKRIKNDLSNNVDRSDVPLKALERQMDLYNQSLRTNFEGENVQEIIYITEEK